MKESEFILDLSNTKGKVQPINMPPVAIQFPNGNVLPIPGDLFMIFESESLADASPNFIHQVGVIHTQDKDITTEALFIRHLKVMKEKKQTKLLSVKRMDFSLIERCCKDFVLPFVEVLN